MNLGDSVKVTGTIVIDDIKELENQTGVITTIKGENATLTFDNPEIEHIDNCWGKTTFNINKDLEKIVK